MSKPIKQMIVREYQARIEGAKEAMLISIRGLKAIRRGAALARAVSSTDSA